MLKTISAALIATSLIAAPAFAAQSGSTAGAAATSTQTQSQPAANVGAPVKKIAKATHGKKLHTARMSRHHGKKISLHKTHHAKVAAKMSSKSVHATKRG